MKIIILSDSHDNIVRLKHVIGFASTLGAEAIIHCGDWNTPLAVKQFDSVKIPVFGVLGNADIDPEMKVKMQNAKVKYDEDFLEIELGSKKILVCHFPTRLEELAEKGNYSMGFCGHTHQRKEWKVGDTTLVSAGALHRTLKPSFVVYDTGSGEVEFVDIEV